ncbi:MAG: TIGR03936 family radical SAM-associated protein [Coriobacteriia bacterium]|nr:TIGR03936 family radical SAM-associated protein [Coriobacteriia bacterium]
MADTTFRMRVTYGKIGRLRFLSHLEVIHSCERTVRRAGLEYAVTQGFSPRMKVAFGPALPVGTEGRAESYDLWLARFVPPAEALEILRGASPDGLTPTGVSYVPEREPSLAAAMTLAEYEVVLEGPDMGPDRFAEALQDVVASGSLELVHKGKHKVYDLEVCLPEGTRVTGDDGRSVATFTVRMGPWGSLRPEALVTEALRSARLDGAVTYVTRTGLRVEEQDA